MNESVLSQEEINALFNQFNEKSKLSIEDFLSPIEIDALGEIGNIALGSSTTALSTLLNQRVEITTPTLSVIERAHIEEEIQEKRVAVHVDYTSGLRGKNVLMIREEDAKIIANLMMGGDGTMVDPELTELHLSAVQEAMNQMMGSAATSMSTIFNKKVDISPPTIDVLGFPPKKLDQLEDNIIIQVHFRLKVGSLIDSKMIQYIPLSFGKEMIHQIMTGSNEDPNQTVKEETPVHTASLNTVGAQHQKVSAEQPSVTPVSQNKKVAQQTNVQKVEFTTFTEPATPSAGIGNIDLLYDIPLTITVELGRTEMPIRKILELGPGSVIELDKLAGEPVDVLANQKLVAKGEVVVIEENFGVRITDIINPIDRITKMTN
ncbi:flagellar motor switch phosphatase FliY [Neobacillus thermocopriae]|uniref:flagellar motor switch phosphatase FliY n=1 Tax=Neobacillus thermocopriae TaxID=1215031 RepID=UPI002E239777|nr:flagellar motor switch phosphatase FliY [Neobacillus thermocopriae]MED3624026.1 flagellar motor switch phosphatase FliY [Neobacillus thermocopriae]MED3713779.1 flagellar motor switch phosphatase FliY [Neobacillus thermocopriae]